MQVFAQFKLETPYGWVKGVFNLVDEQISDIVFDASEEKTYSSRKWRLPRRTWIRGTWRRRSMEKRMIQKNWMKDEYDALADLLDF